mgnify:CR=1 FL=1
MTKLTKIAQKLKIKIIYKKINPPVPTFWGNATGSTEVFLGLSLNIQIFHSNNGLV